MASGFPGIRAGRPGSCLRVHPAGRGDERPSVSPAGLSVFAGLMQASRNSAFMSFSWISCCRDFPTAKFYMKSPCSSGDSPQKRISASHLHGSQGTQNQPGCAGSSHATTSSLSQGIVIGRRRTRGGDSTVLSQMTNSILPAPSADVCPRADPLSQCLGQQLVANSFGKIQQVSFYINYIISLFLSSTRGREGEQSKSGTGVRFWLPVHTRVFSCLILHMGSNAPCIPRAF